jgi:hypothetical protein
MRTAFRAGLCAALAVAAVAPRARADEAQAETDWKELESWLESESAKKPEEKKGFPAEAEKRLRAFIDKHKDVAKYANPARYVLGRMLLDQHKPEKAAPLLEEVAKSDDQDLRAKGRFTLVRALCDKHDTKTARAKLDAFLKDDPDNEDLKRLDDYVKKLEGLGARAAALKKGADAPAVAGQAADGSDFTLDTKGKVAVVEFTLSAAPPFKKGISALKKIADKWKDKLVVVSVLIDPDPDKAKKEAKDATWTVLAGDKARDTARDWGIKTVPYAAIIKDGKLAAVMLRSDQPEELAAQVEYAITGKKPKEKEEDSVGIPSGE